MLRIAGHRSVFVQLVRKKRKRGGLEKILAFYVGAKCALSLTETECDYVIAMELTACG
jgi:hypothetical protein